MTTKVLIHRGKHGDTLYDASTPDAYRRALASIMLNETYWVYEPAKPAEPKSVNVDVSVNATAEEVKAILAQAQEATKSYQQAIKHWERDKAEHDEFHRLAAEGIDALAPRAQFFWDVFFDGGEYNDIEVETVLTP